LRRGACQPVRLALSQQHIEDYLYALPLPAAGLTANYVNSPPGCMKPTGALLGIIDIEILRGTMNSAARIWRGDRFPEEAISSAERPLPLSISCSVQRRST